MLCFILPTKQKDTKRLLFKQITIHQRFLRYHLKLSLCFLVCRGIAIVMYRFLEIRYYSTIMLHSNKSPWGLICQNSFPTPMAEKTVPISVLIALGHASANAVKATAGGCSGSLVGHHV